MELEKVSLKLAKHHFVIFLLWKFDRYPLFDTDYWWSMLYKEGNALISIDEALSLNNWLMGSKRCQVINCLH